MEKLNYFLVLFFESSRLIFSKQKKERTFWVIRENYQKMTIDDIRAMPFVVGNLNELTYFLLIYQHFDTLSKSEVDFDTFKLKKQKVYSTQFRFQMVFIQWIKIHSRIQ
ncbi:hypothetical protein CLU96_1677 [Chryseobacterium sp. 52]|nr:hypothetical protein CLU96_1677 [Chryseobacterium sp. 52]